jgi:phosphate transport system permease protein
MTDVALPRLRTHDITSDAAKARLRARYRSEARFRAYGVAAIVLTAVFLVVVLADIVVKGLPAFTQHVLQMNIKVDRAEIDPQDTKDPAVIRAGDFQLLVRNAMREQFPGVTGRIARRMLDGIVSSGGADELRARVVADPSLIGQTVRVPVLLSDDADLYFKGLGTRITREAGRGTATVTGTTGEVTVTSTADDFVKDLAVIKRELSAQARTARTEAARLTAVIQSVEATRAAAERTLAAARTAGDATRTANAERQLATVTEEASMLGRRMTELSETASALQTRFEGTAAEEPLEPSLPSLLVAINGGLVKLTRIGASSATGVVVLPLASTAAAKPGEWRLVTYVTPESSRKVTDQEVAWLETLRDRGMVESRFNTAFFTSGDSREPELAGIRGALVGSALTLLVTLVLCLPIGVAAAIYLEEFAPKNRLTEIIEVNINNLAAVPSIVFGLLGLAVFLSFFGLPRSAPLVGGLVLALLVLPTIIIASRAAIKAVPPSIKEAALGVGASHQQAVFHHVLPLAMPGIMTGTIIGMAHALGETAPLLMIGMVAFIVEPATSITDAATVLPVQIYLWSDLPEIAFQAKTAAAIMVLLVFLFVMNGTAILLRKRFERRW